LNVPSYSEWNDQNELDTPPIHQVIFGYGIMAGASALAFIHLARNGYSKVRPEIKLMIYWIIATLILIYSPLNVQRRFLEGLHVPMAVMTGIFIFSVLPHYIKDRRLASGLLIIMILFLPLTNIYLFHKRTVAQDTGRGSFPYNVPAYLEQGEDEALRWIAEKTSPGEVILSGYNIGNYIPAYANRRVFLGHWAQTIRFYERAEMVDSFYKTGDLSLIDHEIDYIYYGVDEKALNPSLSLPGEEVFHNDLVQIYKVR